MFLSMAITYLILAVIAGVSGYALLAGDAAWIAQAFFFVFLVAFGISFVMKRQSYHKNTRSSHQA